MNFTNSPYFFGLFSQGQWSPRPPRYTSTTLPCDMESTMMMGSSGCFFNSSMRSRRTWRGTAKNEQNQLAIFPECVARVPVSLWGSGGWGCVRSTLLPRPQPFATVRNRPQPFARSPYGRAYGKFCRGGPFWGLQTCRCFVSRGRRGTSWHSDVFWNVSKVVAWQAQYFCDVVRGCVAVFVAGAALWTCLSSFFVAGAAL